MILCVTSLGYCQNDTIVNTLNEVIINGVRVSKKSPIAQTTINSTEVNKTNQGFEPSLFVLKTPNVTMSTDNGTPFGYTYFRIRGIDQSRINVTLNGMPLNDPEDQGVFFSNIPNFMDNVESFQVQRGVGTSSNGVSSFGGSINYNTPNGTNKETSVKYMVGSFSTVRVGGLYSSGLLNKKYSVSLNANTFRTDGYKYNSGARGYSLFLNARYVGEVDKFRLTVLNGRSRNGMSWQAVSESDIANDPRTNYNEENSWDNFSQTIIQLEHSKKLTNTSNLTTSIFYNKLEGAYDYIMDGTKNLSLNADLYGVISNFNHTTNNFKLDYGISANMYDRKHSYTFAENNTGHKNEASNFLKVKVGLGKLSLFADAQIRFVEFTYDGDVSLPYGTINWKFFNPKGGARYSFRNNRLVYFSVGKSHREPTRTNMFNGYDYLDATVGFNNVKPESVVDYELGYKNFGDKLNLEFNLFYMDFKNEITLLGGVTPSGVPITGSVDRSYRQGIELDLNYKVTKNILVSYNESLTDAKVRNVGESFSPILTPKTIRNISLAYSTNRFLFQVTSRHQSSSFIDLSNDNTIDAFTVYDINIKYTENNWTTMLTIGNLTNKRYYTNGNMVGRDFLPSAERQLFVNSPLNAFLTLKYTL